MLCAPHQNDLINDPTKTPRYGPRYGARSRGPIAGHWRTLSAAFSDESAMTHARTLLSDRVIYIHLYMWRVARIIDVALINLSSPPQPVWDGL